MENKIKIAIVGAGSSGLFAANILVENKNNLDIDIFEKSNKIGRKILASGNGKCNFTNLKSNSKFYNNEIFSANVLSFFDVKKTLDFFLSKGLIYKSDEEGRCYPYSLSAQTILDILVNNMEKKVNIIFNEKVEKIDIKDEKIFLSTQNFNKEYNYIILASGGISSNLSSLENNDYLKSLQLKINDYKPSLVPVKIKENLKSISGLRAKAMVTLYGDNNELYEESGEVLFKENSLSGIVIFQMSHFINKYSNINSFKLKIDIFPDYDETALFDFLKIHKELILKNVLLSFHDKRII